MKVIYDKRTDTLSVILQEGRAVTESDEDKPGIILDYDDAGNLVSLEILDASRRVTEAHTLVIRTFVEAVFEVVTELYRVPWTVS